MLFLVLALVIGALGLLVVALVTAVMSWAWLSVGASALAAALLIANWWRRRSLAAPPVADWDRDTEPLEEDTNAADLLAVAELSVEVRVVDERPRYHLATCQWLNNRPTLGLPIREARKLGFTPCATCTPNHTLATANRRITPS